MHEELAILEASGGLDAWRIATMARKIWTEHYTPIIGKAQVR